MEVNETINTIDLAHVAGQGVAIAFWFNTMLFMVINKNKVKFMFFFNQFLLAFAICASLCLELKVNGFNMDWNLITWYPVNVFLALNQKKLFKNRISFRKKIESR